LTIPGFVSPKKSEWRRFVSALSGALAEFYDRDVTKIVVDLRKNFGGNMWPMVEGLQTLFDRKATVGGFKISGKASYFTAYGKSRRQPSAGKYNHYPKPVDILVGRGTTSSGEIIAAMLTMLPRARLKGSKTGGYLSVNRTFELKGGGTLALMVGAYVDGRGRSLGKRLTPKALKRRP
jgi:carboxyl-terminal processing protease